MKVKRYRQIYEAINQDGEVIARGLSEDVAMVVGCQQTTLCGSAISGNKLFGKFTIKKIGRKYVEYEPNIDYVRREEERRKKIADELLENNLWCLRNYGNTIVTKDIDWHLDYFRENGFDCEARRSQSVNERGRRERYYVVEVKNARSERKSV